VSNVTNGRASDAVSAAGAVYAGPIDVATSGLVADI